MRGVVRVLFILVSILLVLEFPRDCAVAHALVDGGERRATAQGLAIVVNKSNPVENLSLADLRKIFLGQKGSWPHGPRIAVLMLDPGEPERETMLREVYRMRESEYRNHFLRGQFAEEVLVLPKTLASPVVMRKYVFNSPGAIGYLLPRDVDQSIKVIRIDGLLPDDKDYKLQVDGRIGD